MLVKKISLLLLTFLSSGFLFSQVKLSTNFESGSLEKHELIDSSKIKISNKDSLIALSYNIYSRRDPLNPIDTNISPSGRWYYFKMEGVKDKQIFLNIFNSEAIRPFFSYDGINFERMDKSENIYNNQVNKIFLRDTVYICHFIPYTYSRLLSKFVEWTKNKDVATSIIGKSKKGYPIQMLRITDNSTPDQNKKIIWIHGRSHPSEAPASWHLEAMIDQILTDSPFAKGLRSNAIFYIVPFINPDGVIGGYSRSSSSGVNLEVNWDRPDSLTEPEVKALKTTLEQITKTKPIDLFLNMHSQIANSVTYWIHTAKSTTDKFYKEQLLLSSLTIDNNPYYSSKDQSFSDVGSRYAEGWIWNKFSEKTPAITFETPYTFYNENKNGEWVSLENLASLATNSLNAINDYLQLNSENRLVIDSPSIKCIRSWAKIDTGNFVYFGNEFYSSTKAGALIKYKLKALKKGEYKIYKWIAGPADKVSPKNSNCWEYFQSHSQKKDGKFKLKIKSKDVGEKFDAILITF